MLSILDLIIFITCASSVQAGPVPRYANGTTSDATLSTTNEPTSTSASLHQAIASSSICGNCTTVSQTTPSSSGDTLKLTFSSTTVSLATQYGSGTPPDQASMTATSSSTVAVTLIFPSMTVSLATQYGSGTLPNGSSATESVSSTSGAANLLSMTFVSTTVSIATAYGTGTPPFSSPHDSKSRAPTTSSVDSASTQAYVATQSSFSFSYIPSNSTESTLVETTATSPVESRASSHSTTTFTMYTTVPSGVRTDTSGSSVVSTPVESPTPEPTSTSGYGGRSFSQMAVSSRVRASPTIFPATETRSISLSATNSASATSESPMASSSTEVQATARPSSSLTFQYPLPDSSAVVQSQAGSSTYQSLTWTVKPVETSSTAPAGPGFDSPESGVPQPPSSSHAGRPNLPNVTQSQSPSPSMTIQPVHNVGAIGEAAFVTVTVTTTDAGVTTTATVAEKTVTMGS